MLIGTEKEMGRQLEEVTFEVRARVEGVRSAEIRRKDISGAGTAHAKALRWEGDGSVWGTKRGGAELEQSEQAGEGEREGQGDRQGLGLLGRLQGVG